MNKKTIEPEIAEQNTVEPKTVEQKMPSQNNGWNQKDKNKEIFRDTGKCRTCRTYGISGLQEIAKCHDFRNMTEIPHHLLRFCSSLKSVTIPDGVTSIGRHAFGKCVNLESITIGNGVTNIGIGAFARVENLQSITIPESVDTIEENVFEQCTNVTVFTPAGSYAETYAKKHNIPFCTIETSL